MTPKPVFTHRRPIDAGFYERLRLEHGARRLAGAPVMLPNSAGLAIDVPAGGLIAFGLPEGGQIVNAFCWNTHDPDERYWAEETMLLEGAFLQRQTRLWGTMARFRPLATVIEDTVTTLRRAGEPQAFHHFAHGGSGTPADWAAKGGPPGTVTSWERLSGSMARLGLPAHLLTENLSLFQKTAIDPVSQAITLLPSDAMPGDQLLLFAEIDLTFAIAASPYREGGTPPSHLDGGARAVQVCVEPPVAVPLGWPYPGVDYPDLSLYLDPLTGRRSTAVGPTPGIGDAK